MGRWPILPKATSANALVEPSPPSTPTGNDERAPLVCSTSPQHHRRQGGANEDDDNAHGRSCTTQMASWCAWPVVALWHGSKITMRVATSYLWSSPPEDDNDTNPGAEETPSPSSSASRPPLLQTRGSAAEPSTPVGGKHIGTNRPIIDRHDSPEYKQFHPGSGYETVDALDSKQRAASSTTTHDGREPTGAVGGVGQNAPSSPSAERSIPTTSVAVVADHSPIYTAHELEKRIETAAAWLPISVKIMPSPRVSLSSLSSCGDLLNQPSPGGGREDPPQAFTVMLVGPVRPPTARTTDTSPTLGDVEDFIVEDVQGMLLSAVQVVDISLTASDFEPADRRRWLTSSPSSLPLARDDDEEDSESFEVLRSRVVGMFQNLVTTVTERQGKPWGLRLSFVRCSLSPMDLLDGLRIPGQFVEYLSFVRCPLSDAHVAALLRRARQDDGFFSCMKFLGLSGTLSADAVRSVLRFLDEEVEQIVLSEFVVPESCANAALGHPIAVRLPHLLVNGKPIQRR